LPKKLLLRKFIVEDRNEASRALHALQYVMERVEPRTRQEVKNE